MPENEVCGMVHAPEIGHRREEGARASIEAGLDRVCPRELLADRAHAMPRPAPANGWDGIELHVHSGGRQRTAERGGVLLDEGDGVQLDTARARPHLAHKARVEDVIRRAQQEAFLRAAKEGARRQQRACEASRVRGTEVDELDVARACYR